MKLVYSRGASVVDGHASPSRNERLASLTQEIVDLIGDPVDEWAIVATLESL